MEKYTVNVHNLYGVITKTFHPKTAHEIIQISPDESMELMGCPIDFIFSIGDETFTVENGDMITYDIQPYYKKGQECPNRRGLTRIYDKGAFYYTVRCHITRGGT